MVRRDRRSRDFHRLLTFLFIASLLTGPASQVAAYQNDNGTFREIDPGVAAQSLIAEQLSTGVIDYETSLVYRAFALFGDPRLPAELAGTGSFGEDNALFGEVRYQWAQLSPETQNLLIPFVSRPTDSRSVYNQPGPPAFPTDAAKEAELTPRYAKPDCSNNWYAKDSQRFPLKVWTHCTGDYEGDLDSAIVMVEDFWEREVALMGDPILDTGSEEQGGDNRIDMYFVDDESDVVPRHGGDTISETALAHASPDLPMVGKGSSGYVVGRRAYIGKPDQILVLAHEFFHILQDAHNWELSFGFKGTPHDNDFEVLTFSEFWFVEATATWVMSYIYRDSIEPAVLQNLVHQRFIKSFQGVDLPLYYSPRQDGKAFGHIYAAYIYFLFIEQELGPEAIADFYDRLKTIEVDDFEGSLAILDEILPFKEHFRDFAVRNLNLDLQPGDPISPSYKDLDSTFPEGIAPPFQVVTGPTSRTKLELGQTESVTVQEAIPSLSAHYFDFAPLYPATRLTLDFTNLGATGSVDVDMIAKVATGNWERRQYDPREPVTLCLANTNDAISLFYLVLTNHESDEAKTARGSFTISVDDIPCM
jgi:hypothetical protein